MSKYGGKPCCMKLTGGSGHNMLTYKQGPDGLQYQTRGSPAESQVANEDVIFLNTAFRMSYYPIF